MRTCTCTLGQPHVAEASGHPEQGAAAAAARTVSPEEQGGTAGTANKQGGPRERRGEADER